MLHILIKCVAQQPSHLWLLFSENGYTEAKPEKNFLRCVPFKSQMFILKFLWELNYESVIVEMHMQNVEANPFSIIIYQIFFS